MSNTFNEYDGTVSNIIKVIKTNDSITSEVDLPLQVVAMTGSSGVGMCIVLLLQSILTFYGFKILLLAIYAAGMQHLMSLFLLF